MHYDCFQHFCVNAFITSNGNIDEFSPEDLNAVRGQMVTMSNQVVGKDELWSPNHYCVLKISISDCYGSKHQMLDRDILRDHGL